MRVGKACKNGYEETITKIREAKWVHIDETGMRVNGKKWWLWIFRSSEDDVLVIIHSSRRSKVPQDILGEDFKGAVIVDGWITVSFEYNPEYISKVKQIEGYRWHPDTKYWRLPYSTEIVGKLKSSFW